jgi:hypothetical protein
MKRTLALLLLTAAATTVHAGGIYWTNRGASLVERALYDGTGRTTVLASAGTNVRGIWLDLPSNQIWYCDNGGDVIYRMNLSGSSRVPVISTTPSPSFPRISN